MSAFLESYFNYDYSFRWYCVLILGECCEVCNVRLCACLPDLHLLTPNVALNETLQRALSSSSVSARYWR